MLLLHLLALEAANGCWQSTSVNYSSQIYDKYKLDDEGNIVQTTADERKRQMNAAKVADANNLNRQVQAWDKAFKELIITAMLLLCIATAE